MNVNELVEKNRAIMAFVEQTIIPIVIDYTDQDGKRVAGTYATGTLFQFDDKYFMMSASHVFDDIEKIKNFVGIPVAFENAQILSFDKCILSRPDNPVARNLYDIAAVRLDSFIVNELKKHYRFLTYSNVGGIDYTGSFYVSGFPSIFSRFEEKQSRVVGAPFRFMTSATVPTQDDLRLMNPSVHILLQYGETVYENGINKTGVSAPKDLGGISGCSIWNYVEDESGLWTPERVLKVVAIQTSVKKYSWIKGTKWDSIANAFENIDPQISQKIKEAVGVH